MECEHLLSLISDYIDEVLPHSQRMELEKHLQECGRCKTLVNTLRATISLCQSLDDVPRAIRQNLHRTLREAWETPRVQVSIGIPRAPYVEVVGLENKIKVSIVIPGVAREDMTLLVARDYIEINGLRKKADGIYYLNEIEHGALLRRIRLPFPVNASKAKAHLRDGILEITLQKARSPQKVPACHAYGR
jgi:HSP20 family molecular chaperone IbpA